MYGSNNAAVTKARPRHLVGLAAVLVYASRKPWAIMFPVVLSMRLIDAKLLDRTI